MGVTNYVKDASQIIIEDKYQTYLKDMRNLEGSIRDWLSLHVSGLALEESRRSIEVSNLQIAESKRCRSGPDQASTLQRAGADSTTVKICKFTFKAPDITDQSQSRSSPSFTYR